MKRIFALVFGLLLVAGAAQAGPPPGGPDTDGDTVENAFDNCLNLVNPDQADTDHNGCGDACTQAITCDTNGDTVVGGPDLLFIAAHFAMPCPGVCGFAVCGGPGLLVLGMEFGHRVGPSG